MLIVYAVNDFYSQLFFSLRLWSIYLEIDFVCLVRNAPIISHERYHAAGIPPIRQVRLGTLS